jgi:hypothetical protein
LIQIKGEIIDICCQLNSPKFPGFSLASSVGLGIFPEITGLTDVLYESILAYELSLRHNKTGLTWLQLGGRFVEACMTDKVIVAVLLFQLWVQNAIVTFLGGVEPLGGAM